LSGCEPPVASAPGGARAAGSCVARQDAGVLYPFRPRPIGDNNVSVRDSRAFLAKPCRE
jgi:hypothetical protein